MANIFDKAIEAVAPTAALKRKAARRALAVLDSGYGNYGANLAKRSMVGWMFGGGDAKADIEDNLDTLRQRSRDAYMGVPLATGAIKTLRTNTIANGLRPTPQIDGTFLRMSTEQVGELQAQIMREFELWAGTPMCDADRIDNFYQLQQLAFLGALMNGDAFALLPMRRDAGATYDLRVRVIEADRVCSPYKSDVLVPTTINGERVSRIVQGVETEADGAVCAYWVCNKHPLAQDAAMPDEWVRVAARGEKTGRPNILHVMTRERAGQLRGVPLLSPVMEALKQIGRYTEAELSAAVITAAFTVFIKKESAGEPPPIGEVVPEELKLPTTDNTNIELAPGAIIDLNPGESIEQTQPGRPNARFEAFYDAIVKQIGTALEIPPEVLHKSFNSNYSAARGALNEFWRVCDMDRGWFVDKFCQPIYEAWFAEAVARGRINAPGFFNDPAVAAAYMKCRWNGPARTNLNPVQEVEAAERRVAAGFSTAEQETAQMTGGSYAANIRQRMIEAQMKKEVDEVGSTNGGTPEQSQVLEVQE